MEVGKTEKNSANIFPPKSWEEKLRAGRSRAELGLKKLRVSGNGVRRRRSKRTGLNCTVHYGRNFQYLSKKNWDQSKFEGLYTPEPLHHI